MLKPFGQMRSSEISDLRWLPSSHATSIFPDSFKSSSKGGPAGQFAQYMRPLRASTTIDRGCTRSSDISESLLEAVWRSATKIALKPSSVQYKLCPTQSTAMPMILFNLEMRGKKGPLFTFWNVHQLFVYNTHLELMKVLFCPDFMSCLSMRRRLESAK